MHTREAIRQSTHRIAKGLGEVTRSSIFQKVQYFVFGVSIVFVILDPILGFTALLTSWAFGKGFVLAWIWGILAGHLFIVRTKGILDEVLAISILVISSLIILCLACFLDINGSRVLNFILLVLGCLAGHLLWPQSLPKAT